MNDSSEIDTALGLAARDLEAGNLCAADLRAHAVLERSPGHARALDLVGGLRERIGFDPERPWREDRGAGGQMLIRAWGSGFWSDVAQVLAWLLVAEITNRTPIVHWGNESLFRDGAGNAWDRFWQPVSNLSLPDVRAQGGVFPAKWANGDLGGGERAKWEGDGSRLGAVHFLGRPEPLIVCDFHAALIDVAPWIPADHPMRGRPLAAIFKYLSDRYLTPEPAVQAMIETQRAGLLADRELLAVHIRGSDKYLEFQPLPALNDRCVQLMDAEPPATEFLLLTDDARWLRLLKDRFGGRIHATASQRSATSVGPHFMKGSDPTALGREVMVDAYLAMACPRFLGNGWSNVSNAIAWMKTWEEGTCRLIHTPMLKKRNFALYRSVAGGG